MKKVIALLITMSFILGTTVFASFPDMKDSKWDWARDTVDNMVAASLIKGYEDNTFRPEKQITKAEAIVLTSRVAGFTQKSAQEFIDLGVGNNTNDIADFSIPYKKEAAYLVYKGVLTKDDYAMFLENSNQPLKRYEAAVLLTKLMDGDIEAKAMASSSTEFEDQDAIPQSAVPYVAFVVKNEIMKGIDAKTFSPMTSVTRAQIAVLLERVIEKLSYAYDIGEVLSIDAQKQTISISVDGNSKEVSLPDEIKICIDGKASDFENIYPSAKVNIIYKDGVPFSIECINPKLDSVVEGTFKEYSRTNGQTIVSVKVDNSIRTIPLSENVLVTYNNKSATIKELMSGDVVKLEVAGNKIISVKAESMDKPVEGTIESIVLEPSLKLAIKDSEGNVVSYDVVSEVKVVKNGTKTTLNNVLVGDSVKATLTYGTISEIIATSTIKIETGILDEIKISKMPSLVIKDSSGKTTKYEVSRNVIIVKDLKNVEIYDLRLGDSVKVTVESGTVTSLEIQSAIVSKTITGVVESINTSYGYIKLVGIDQIVFTSKAKYIDNSGNSKSSRDVAVGKSLIITGTASVGGYEASLVIIN